MLHGLAQALRRLGHVIAASALVGMLLVTVVDVIGRRFGSGVPGVIDIVELCVVWATMLGIAVAWAERQHILVDIIDLVVPPGVVVALDWIARILAAVCMGVLVWLAWRELADVADFGDRTADLRLPLSWHWSAVLVGYGLSAVILILGPTRRLHA